MALAGSRPVACYRTMDTLCAIRPKPWERRCPTWPTLVRCGLQAIVRVGRCFLRVVPGGCQTPTLYIRIRTLFQSLCQIPTLKVQPQPDHDASQKAAPETNGESAHAGAHQELEENATEQSTSAYPTDAKAKEKGKEEESQRGRY